MRKFAAFFLLLMLFACKKDEPAKNVVGLWTGKIGFGTAAPNTNRAFLFRSNGTARHYATHDTSTAQFQEYNYQLSGNTITIEGSVNVVLKWQATINTEFSSMEGTYGFKPATSGEGTFYMDRQ